MNEEMSAQSGESCACERLVKNFRDGFGDVRRAVGDLANQTCADVKEAGEEAFQQLKDVRQTKTKTMEESIRREPLRAMFLSAGVGLILGMYIRR